MSSAKNFQLDDLVWGKVKGYTPWPAKIILIEEQRYYVNFFCSHNNYAWLKKNNLFHFEKFYNTFSKRNKTAAFQKAVQEAFDESEKQRSGVSVSLSNEDEINELIPKELVVQLIRCEYEEIPQQELKTKSPTGNETVAAQTVFDEPEEPRIDMSESEF